MTDIERKALHAVRYNADGTCKGEDAPLSNADLTVLDDHYLSKLWAQVPSVDAIDLYRLIHQARKAVPRPADFREVLNYGDEANDALKWRLLQHALAEALDAAEGRVAMSPDRIAELRKLTETK